MKIIFGAILVLIVSGVVLVGGYSGKIPVVSKALGATEAKDLGIDYANVKVEGIYDRLETEVIINPEKAGKAGVMMEGKKEVEYTLTQEEMSALANGSPLKHNPFSNTQIRINKDGSVEASTVLKVEKLFEFANAMGYSGDEVREQMEKYKIPVRDIPVYGKATGYVKNNKVTADFSKIQVSGIPLPSFIIEQAEPQLEKAAEGVIESFPSFNAESMTFENGKMDFKGTIPEKQYFE